MIQSVLLDFGQKFRALLAYSPSRRNLKNAKTGVARERS